MYTVNTVIIIVNKFIIIIIIGWFRFDPSRGTDYRVLVAISNINKRTKEMKSDYNNKNETLYTINAFRELSILPRYIQNPMKR